MGGVQGGGSRGGVQGGGPGGGVQGGQGGGMVEQIFSKKLVFEKKPQKG